MKSLEVNIKKWYITAYPTDDMGNDINEDVTFRGLFECLDSYQDVYEFLGVDDSIVRERVFMQLAILMNVDDYDYIYEQWLKA